MSLPNKKLYSIRPKPGDIILALLILLAAALLSLRLSRGADGQTALIYENGVLTHTISLSGTGGYRLELEHCSVEVANGKIRFLESDCPDKLCVRTGWISRSGESAVCLPNRVEIVILGDSVDVDAIT
jgi:hypothetical protein